VEASAEFESTVRAKGELGNKVSAHPCPAHSFENTYTKFFPLFSGVNVALNDLDATS
jgi:hypothetical protein